MGFECMAPIYVTFQPLWLAKICIGVKCILRFRNAGRGVWVGFLTFTLVFDSSCVGRSGG